MRVSRACRHRNTSGNACRRQPQHHIHQKCDREHCMMAHHAFVSARPYAKERNDSDPFVRTSVFVRRSDLTYLRVKFGTAAAGLHRLIAAERGITGKALVKHLRGEAVYKRLGGGTFAPSTVAEVEPSTANCQPVVDGPYVPPEERPASTPPLSSEELLLEYGGSLPEQDDGWGVSERDCLDCGTCDSCIERTKAYFEEMAAAKPDDEELVDL